MDGTDPIALLKEFGAERKKRIQSCEIYDSNVCSSTINESTGWHLRLTSGYKFTHEIRMKIRGRRVHIAASPEYIQLRMDGRLDAVPCSINRPNRVSFVDKPTEMQVGGDPQWPVFIMRQGVRSESLSSLLALTKLHLIVSQIIKSQKDSVHVFEGAIIAYFHPASAMALQHAIDSLCEFVGARTRVSARSLRTLPENLTPLIPLIKKWAESDDGWRAEMLGHARKSDVEELVATVEPFLGQIDKYLDTSQDEAACALGRLAEFVAEAKIGLKRQES